jgi:hypothetical protein
LTPKVYHCLCWVKEIAGKFPEETSVRSGNGPHQKMFYSTRLLYETSAFSLYGFTNEETILEENPAFRKRTFQDSSQAGYWQSKLVSI